ncbi:MAG: MFS transporter, partial [Candidatus Methylumidiphilus sp.]
MNVQSSVPTAISHRKRLVNIFSGSIGNLVEYFDWAIYAAFALYFAPVFFPEGDQTAQLMNSAVIFAAGFVCRPLGGWLMGRLADRHGRKSALLLSVSLMCLGSLIIACTPGYALIGPWAPALLLFARLLQGFSIGGEYGSSATYLSEMATPDRRGYFSSFQYVTIVLGQLLALTLLMALQKWFLTGDELHQWGWRIPFIFGGMLSVVALGLRGRMAETNAFVEQHAYIKGQATLAELRKHPKAVMTVVALTAGGTVSYYTLTVYMQKFLVNTTGFSKDDATLICLFALFLFMLAQPVFGLISDRVGRRFMLIGFGLGA